MEGAEGQGLIVLLDWEKAFDKVNQQMLVQTIELINVPPKIVRVLETFQNDPRFRIKDSEGVSTYRRQPSGIRTRLACHRHGGGFLAPRSSIPVRRLRYHRDPISEVVKLLAESNLFSST